MAKDSKSPTSARLDIELSFARRLKKLSALVSIVPRCYVASVPCFHGVCNSRNADGNQ